MAHLPSCRATYKPAGGGNCARFIALGTRPHPLCLLSAGQSRPAGPRQGRNWAQLCDIATAVWVHATTGRSEYRPQGRQRPSHKASRIHRDGEPHQPEREASDRLIEKLSGGSSHRLPAGSDPFFSHSFRPPGASRVESGRPRACVIRQPDRGPGRICEELRLENRFIGFP